MIRSWKADVYCFQETKIEGDINNIVKDLWANRTSGTRGGILIKWDGIVCTGEVSSVSCKFTGKSQDYSWFLTGIYAPTNRIEREEV